ncbi:hypothetical protein H920_10486 [Fukomys damarensis]|uniref:Uncharacterized protein n=1 Tax=Fukomys damarensis TaxID=885580 RepID=A0A091DAK9_FUKDA|nr:hypothetical protein H920_10486 [Fukomys damarensis]
MRGKTVMNEGQALSHWRLCDAGMSAVTSVYHQVCQGQQPAVLGRSPEEPEPRVHGDASCKSMSRNCVTRLRDLHWSQEATLKAKTDRSYPRENISHSQHQRGLEFLRRTAQEPRLGASLRCLDWKLLGARVRNWPVLSVFRVWDVQDRSQRPGRALRLPLVIAEERKFASPAFSLRQPLQGEQRVETHGTEPPKPALPESSLRNRPAPLTIPQSPHIRSLIGPMRSSTSCTLHRGNP